MDNILVTGGAGYVGSHCCKCLAQSGYSPVVYDNLYRGHRELVRWGALEVGDVRDKECLQRVFTQYKPIAVIHCAALAYVGESMENPSAYYSNNVGGTLTLLDVMRAEAVNTIVFSSTCAAYGIPETLPITEKTQQSPINPYGNSKFMVEQILADSQIAEGLNFIGFRYFNAAGADSDGEIGELHDPETHLIPRAMMAATGQIPHLDIFGDDYDTPDGTCVRDYIHVMDLAEAHVHALDFLQKDGESGFFNLGSGRGYSVRQVIEATENITGLTIPRKIRGRRPGDVATLIADASLAAEKLNFSPRFSDLDTITQTAWKWHDKKTNNA